MMDTRMKEMKDTSMLKSRVNLLICRCFAMQRPTKTANMQTATVVKHIPMMRVVDDSRASLVLTTLRVSETCVKGLRLSYWKVTTKKSNVYIRDMMDDTVGNEEFNEKTCFLETSSNYTWRSFPYFSTAKKLGLFPCSDGRDGIQWKLEWQYKLIKLEYAIRQLHSKQSNQLQWKSAISSFPLIKWNFRQISLNSGEAEN